MRQVLYKANDFMGTTVRKGDIIGVTVIAEDMDSGVKLVLSPGADEFECACMFFVKPVSGEDYHENVGDEDAYINISRTVQEQMEEIAAN